MFCSTKLETKMNTKDKETLIEPRSRGFFSLDVFQVKDREGRSPGNEVDFHHVPLTNHFDKEERTNTYNTATPKVEHCNFIFLKTKSLKCN